MVVISYGYLVIRWNSETIISDQMRCTINHYTWYIMYYVSNTYTAMTLNAIFIMINGSNCYNFDYYSNALSIV